ncbi:alpha/beta fold hydrolase [Flavihumibacter sp.]|uniref:alpha/beta fold hydrolase n=1 Tax=Flavihumibacter sp. TaxID=1913981 RepID=UPI002FC62B72
MNIKTVELPNSLKMEYVEQGDPSGRQVIFLHGYPDSWQSYATLLPYLPANIHAYAPSQRGHGNTDRPGHGYDPKDFAADLALFMDHLNIDAAVIVGHSMGASIALRFALDHPEKTKGLILIGGFSTFIGNENMTELLEEVNALSDPVDRDFMEEFQISTVVHPLGASYLKTLVDESLKIPANVLKAILSQLVKVDYTRELNSIKVPVLLVWGDHDNLTGRENQDQFLRLITGSRLSVYSGIGHSVHWEEPERFANEVDEFVNMI